MKIKWIVITVACFIAVTIAIAKRAPGKQSGTDYKPTPTSETVSQPVPDHTVYRFLFRKVVYLQERTNELQRKGKVAPNSYYPLQDEVNLNSAQLRVLSLIASACERDVALKDERARGIIEAFRGQFPSGRIPRGVTPPPPPSELQTLWAERNAIILQARDQLRMAFGEETFAQFDDYVKFRYGTNLRPVSPGLMRRAPK